MDLSRSTGFFADELFKEIASSTQSNLLISPVGIFTVLSMLLAGSRSNTRQQLQQVMRLPSNATSLSVDEYFEKLIRAYESISHPPNQLTMSNLMLLSKGRTCGCRGILQDYEDIITQQYHAELQRVNFKKSPLPILQAVNSWINESTYGLIDRALDTPPAADTNILLINVIYFNYQWVKRFKASNVNQFFVNGNTPVNTPFMKVEASLRYMRTSCKSDAHVQLIQVPYRGEFSMIVMLPSANATLDRVLEKESLSNLASMLLKKGRPREIELHMPKFKFDFRESLVQPLKHLGLDNLFETPVDLSGINGEKNLRVSSLEHVTAIDVNEIGTQAAAVTVVGVSTTALLITSPKVVVVDRPFAFLIYDTTRNLPLFVGRLTSP